MDASHSWAFLRHNVEFSKKKKSRCSDDGQAFVVVVDVAVVCVAI